MESQYVNYHVADQIGYVTLNRPKKLNAINCEMLESLFDAFEDVRSNRDVRVCILTGHGESFSAGHDLFDKDHEELMKEEASRERSGEDFYLLLREIEKPIIAGIHGYCIAQGMGIALSADIRVAAEDTKIGHPGAKRGIGSASGPSILAHLIPMNIALECLLTGEFMDADTAFRFGLVNHVVPRSAVLDKCKEIASKIRENSPLAVSSIKSAAMKGWDKPLQERLQIAMSAVVELAGTGDAEEGLRALADRRAAQWSGH